jgi:hypothetical protein
MADVERLSYRVVRSCDLSKSDIKKIGELTSTSVRLDYPDLSDEEVGELRSETERGIKNSNRLVPKLGLKNGRRLNPRQVFARSVSTFAETQYGTPVAHINFADNVSSSTIAGPVERWAKLYREEFLGKKTIEHRVFRIGHPAMSEEVHKQMEKDPSKINPFDVMIGKVAYTRDPRQPARAYVWLGEAVWRTKLERLGALPVMKKDEETGELIPDIRDSKPFGANGRIVKQQTLEIPSLSVLMTNIMNIPGAEELIDVASHQQESQ